MRLPSFAAASAKPFRLVVRTALAGALIGSVLSSIAPARTTVSLSFTVAQQARQATADYAYDGYYALRAAELVSDTLISWLSTPSIIKEIYASSGHDVSDDEALALAGRAFRAKKFSSQNVVVSFSASDPAAAADVASKASEVL